MGKTDYYKWANFITFLLSQDGEWDRFLFLICLCVCVSHSVMSDSLGCMDCGPPGSSVPWNSPGKMLEYLAIPFSKGSSWPRDQTPVSCIAGRLFILNHQGITVFCLGSIKNVNTTECLFHLIITDSLLFWHY